MIFLSPGSFSRLAPCQLFNLSIAVLAAILLAVSSSDCVLYHDSIFFRIFGGFSGEEEVLNL